MKDLAEAKLLRQAACAVFDAEPGAAFDVPDAVETYVRVLHNMGVITLVYKGEDGAWRDLPRRPVKA